MANKRPKLVWIISIFCILASLMQLLSHTLFISGLAALDERGQAVIASWTLLEKITPYILITILLLASTALIAMKRIAFELYLAYLVLVTLATIQQAITTDWIEQFGMAAWSAVAGIVIFSLIVWYVYRLRSLDKLK